MPIGGMLELENQHLYSSKKKISIYLLSSETHQKMPNLEEHSDEEQEYFHGLKTSPHRLCISCKRKENSN